MRERWWREKDDGEKKSRSAEKRNKKSCKNDKGEVQFSKFIETLKDSTVSIAYHIEIMCHIKKTAIVVHLDAMMTSEFQHYSFFFYPVFTTVAKLH